MSRMEVIQNSLKGMYKLAVLEGILVNLGDYAGIEIPKVLVLTLILRLSSILFGGNFPWYIILLGGSILFPAT